MLQDLLSVFFPNNCSACQQPMVKGESVVCTECLFNLPYTEHHLHADNPVEKLFWGRANVQAAMALLYFNKGNRVQRLLHQLKYQNNQEVGILIGHILGSRIKQSNRFADIDLIIPVPLHQKKLYQRGFNQSELIARGIAKETGIELSLNVLTRQINNPTQTNKARFERFENVSGAFMVSQISAENQRNILLVDDVVTTGSTLESCINALTHNNLAKVSVCVAACAE